MILEKRYKSKVKIWGIFILQTQNKFKIKQIYFFNLLGVEEL